MPDIISPSTAPSIDISDIDLGKATQVLPIAQNSSDPFSGGTAAMQPMAISSPFNLSTKGYQPTPRSVSREDLSNVGGYNAYKGSASYNPELSPMENVRGYAANQGKAEYAANLGVKLWNTTVDSFISTFGQNKRNIDALMDIKKDGWDALNKLYSTDDNSKVLEEERYKHPTFGTGENDNSWTRFNPFTAGKSDFYGEFIPQLGFSLGTMGETVAENVAIGAIAGVATGGAATVAEAANDVAKIGKFAKLFKGLGEVFEASNGITNFKKAVNIIDSIKNEGSLMANIKSGVVKGAKLLANGYAMYNTAAGEASFEANNIYNDHLKQLTQDFIDKNGYQPYGEDLQKIKNSSSSTAISTFGWNMPILLGSNLIQFGNILKPFKGALAETIEETALDVVGKGIGKTIEEAAEKKVTSKLASVFHFATEHLAEPFSEGMEEIMQSAASTGSSQYYKDLYNGMSQGTSTNDALNSVWKYAHTAAFTDDFVGGFLGGAVFAGAGGIAEVSGFKDTKLGKKITGGSEKFKEGEKQKVVDNALGMLNKVSNEELINYLFKPDVQNFVSQVANKQRLKNATQNEDILGYKDAQNQSVRDLIYAGLKTGKLDIALSKLEIFKELDNTDLAKYTNTTDVKKIEKAKQRASDIVDEIKEKALNLQSYFSTINEKYPNQYKPGSLEYNAHEAALKDRLYSRDIVETDKRRALGLRIDISHNSDGVISDNVLNQAVDTDALSKSIEDLQYFLDNAPDKTDPGYAKKKQQLKHLQDIEKNRGSEKPSYRKMARSVSEIAKLNTTAPYAEDIDNEDNLKRIEDVLKLEHRNKLSLGYYQLLNNKPMESSVAEHITALQMIAEMLKEQDAPVETTAPETTTPAEETKIPTPFDQPEVKTPPAGGTVVKTASKNTPEEDNFLSTIGTKENYESWSNVRDNSDRAQFEDQILTAHRTIQKTDPTKRTKENIEAYLKGIKAFANRTYRDLAVGLLVKAKSAPVVVPGPSSGKVVTIETPDNTEEEKNLEEQANPGFRSKPGAFKIVMDIAPPSEKLSTQNPTDNQFHRRKDQFLENLHLGRLPIEGKKGKFWSKNDVKILIVTANNAANYGKNISSVLTNKFDVPARSEEEIQKRIKADIEEFYKKNPHISQKDTAAATASAVIRARHTSVALSDLTADQINKLDNASVMYLFGVEDPKTKEITPITKDGKLLPKVSPSTEYKIQDLIYSFNEPSSDISYKRARFAAGANVAAFQKKHRELRLKMLNSTENIVQPFEISHGLPNTIKGQGKINTIKDAKVIPSNHQIQWDDIYIPTTATKDQVFQEVNTGSLTSRNLRVGRPYLSQQFDHQRLETSRLTSNQKGAVLLSIKEVAKAFFANKTAVTDSNEHLSFIKHLMFLQSGNLKDVYQKPASLYFEQGAKDGSFSIFYDFSGQPKEIKLTAANIEKTFDDIIANNAHPFRMWLQNRYFNVAKPTNQSFKEFYTQGKELKERSWDSYTQYLLDNKNRPTEEVPLKVELYSPDQQQDPKLFEGGNKYPSLRKQYYVKLGQGPIRDDKGNAQAAPAQQKVVKQQAPKQGNKYQGGTVVTSQPVKQQPVTSSLLKLSDNSVRQLVGFYNDDLAYNDNPFYGKKISMEEWIKQNILNPPTIRFKTVVMSKGIKEEILPFAKAVKAAQNTTQTAPVGQQVNEVVEPEPQEPVPAGDDMDFDEEPPVKVFHKLFQTSPNYTAEDISAVKDFFQKNLPQVSVNTVDRLIKLADGKLAWGTYSNAVVTLYNQAIRGTGYHEAFEVVFNSLLSKREQDNHLKEFRQRQGTFSNFATNGEINYKDATDSQAREEMAEEFMRFKENNELVTPHKNFFEKLLDFIKKFIFGLPAINDTFSRLDNGYFANKELSPTDGTYTSQVVNVGPVERGYILKGLTYEMINNLFEQTTSFTKFDEKFDEQEIYRELKEFADNFYTSKDNSDPNTYFNMVRAEYYPQIKAATDPAQVKILKQEANEKWKALNTKWTETLAPQWDNIVLEHKKFLKQLGVLSLKEVEGDTDENEQNKNDYTRDTFKIDIKNTAPSSIRLLFNTLAESIFPETATEYETLQDGRITIPKIQPKIVDATGMVTLSDIGKELFNITLNHASEINTIDGIKEKLEKMLGIDKIIENADDTGATQAYIQSRLEQEEKLPNSIYTHLFKLYTRVFKTSEDKLSEAEVKQRLKFLSTFSKQRPDFRSMIVSNSEVYFLDEIRDKGRIALERKWMKNLYNIIGDYKTPSLLSKSSKQPFQVNYEELDRLKKGIPSDQGNEFILQTGKALGMDEINTSFLDELNWKEKANLFRDLHIILGEGIAKTYNGTEGKRYFKLNSAQMDVSSPYARIADLILEKQGDISDSIHTNIEGEQQQNVIQNNAISNTLSAINNADTRDEFLAKNPHFNDTFVNSSQLLQKFFNENGDRTDYKPKITVIGGIKQLTKSKGKKSSSHSLSERLFTEFNANLNNIFYVLMPSDSETEWALDTQNGYVKYTDDVLNASNLSILTSYLQSEIQSALEYKDPNDSRNYERTKNDNLSKKRPLRDGTIREVGASLQVFKDILSDKTVAKIHSLIDKLTPADKILSTVQKAAVQEIGDYIKSNARETFKNLDQSGITSRLGSEVGQTDSEIAPNSQYVFYGMDSKFVADKGKFQRNTTINPKDNTVVDAKNQHLLSSKQLENLIHYRELQYIINNIEMTKLFFGNPYFYKDILKRTKSLMSGRENTYTQHETDQHRFDDWFNKNKNTVTDGETSYELPSSHLHNHQFKSNLHTWVFKDHETLNKELSQLNQKYAKNNATDAQSFITLGGYREMYWKSGARFRETQERQFQIEQAYERMLMHQDDVMPYTDQKLHDLDLAIITPYLKKGELLAKEDVFEIFKPIGSGAMANQQTFDPYIWKTSVAPITYRMVRGTPMQEAYVNMLKEGIDVLTFESAMKVGLTKDPTTGKVNPLMGAKSFKDLGKITDISSYNHKLPFSTIGLQLETSTQKSKGTIGTQTTKLIVTDLFEYGLPTDFMTTSQDFEERLNNWFSLSEEEKLDQSPYYRLERAHDQAIRNLEDYGYYDLLDKLGVEEITNDKGEKEYQYDNLNKVYELLKDEMVRRGMSANIYDMFEDQEIKVKPIEALSNYAQASFIIMSVVRKNLIRPKLNGGQKIQASSVFLNSLKDEHLKANYKDAEGNWQEITDKEQFDKLSDAEKKSITYSSEQLKFYSKDEDGNTNAMEIMLPNTFKKKLDDARSKKGLPALSDKELLDYLQKNQSKLLSGIGFRIPTQALSSIDTFRVKGFLPSYMGDSVVVPSELTTKVGSDFDVDKLNTYLANFTVSSKGYPQYTEASSSIAEAREKFGKEFDQKAENTLREQGRLLSALDAYIQYQEQEGENSLEEYTTKRIANYIRKNEDRLSGILDKFDTDEDAIESLIETLQKLDGELSDEAVRKELRDKFISKRVKGSLENHYFNTVDQILKLPRNFDRLLSPNNSDEFEGSGQLRDKILEAQGKLSKDRKKDYLNYSTIVDSNAMRYSRWAYVLGKKGVGIAALSATNHVNSQKIGFKINLHGITPWYEDTAIHFNHNQLRINGQTTAVLSGITKANGKSISEFISKYVNGYVDVAKDPWILDIGAQMEIAGIYLTMERMGIDEQEIIFFMNQPAVKHFLNIQTQRTSPINSINPDMRAGFKDYFSDEAIYNKVQQMLVGDTPSFTKGNFTMDQMTKAIQKGADFPTLSQWAENANTKEKQMQFTVFNQFMQLRDLSNYIRKSQTATNFDTANLNSLHLIDDKEDAFEDLNFKNAPRMITTLDESQTMSEALLSNTFAGNIYNRVTALDKQLLSKAVFRIQDKKVRSTIRKIMYRLNPSIRWGRESDRREMMDKLSKAVINILALNTDRNSKSGTSSLMAQLPTTQKFDNLFGHLKKVNNIIKDKDGNIKKSVKNKNKDLADLANNKWLNNINTVRIASDSEFGYYSVVGKPQDNFEREIWINDYNKLKEIPATQNYAKMLLLSALLQSGADYNRETYIDLMPWQDYTAPLNNGLDDLDAIHDINIERMIAQNKAYDTDFVPEIEQFTPGEVNGKLYWPKYLKIGTSKGELVADVKIYDLYKPSDRNPNWVNSQSYADGSQEISSLVFTPKGSFRTKGLNYFTLKQNSHRFTKEEIKGMQQAKNFDYLTKILFERTPITFKHGAQEFEVFRPINTKGNRYIQEYAMDNEYSVLDTHDHVNSDLVDNSRLFTALKNRYPGKVTMEEQLEEEPDVSTIVTTEEEKPAETTEEKPNEKGFTKAEQDIIDKSNLEAADFKKETIGGKSYLVNTSQIPNKINKGSQKFYSLGVGGYYIEKWGKPVTIPGFEDLKFMMSQDKSLYELSTGLSIPIKARAEKDIIAEAKELFEKKNVRLAIQNATKIDINNTLDIKEKSTKNPKKIALYPLEDGPVVGPENVVEGTCE